MFDLSFQVISICSCIFSTFANRIDVILAIVLNHILIENQRAEERTVSINVLVGMVLRCK